MADTNANKSITSRDIPVDPMSRRGFHARKRRLDVPTLERMIRSDPRFAHDLTVGDFLTVNAGISPNAVNQYCDQYDAQGVCWVTPSSIIHIMGALDLTDPTPLLIATRERLG